jgi:hypothetical protein
MATISEPQLIADVERRLASKYPHIPPAQIAFAIENARARFENSRIRDFVPLLVERHARAELSQLREPAGASH